MFKKKKKKKSFSSVKADLAVEQPSKHRASEAAAASAPPHVCLEPWQGKLWNLIGFSRIAE